MAHASGIVPDQALADAMGSAKEGRKPRFLKLQIDDDKLVLRSSNDGTDNPKSGDVNHLAMEPDDARASYKEQP